MTPILRPLLASTLLLLAVPAMGEEMGWLSAPTKACADGAVSKACKCGTSKVTTGYCCSGVAQAVGCSLLAVAFSAPGCVATGATVGAGGEALTYSRALTRTCNVSGTIQTCAANQACVEGAGLLVEPTRINYVLYPTALSNAWWNWSASGGVTVALEAGLDAASNSGALIQADTSSARHFLGAVNKAIGANGTDVFAVSFHAKAGTNTHVAMMPLGLTSYNFSNIYIIMWNLGGSGSLVYNGASTGAINYALSPVSGATGWFRMWGTSSYTVSGTNGSMDMILGDVANPIVTQWTTAGTENFHVWGPQIERGAYATSFIPASGSAATRNADVPSVPWPAAASAAPCVKLTATPEYGRSWSAAAGTLWEAGTDAAANSARLTADASGNLVFDVYDNAGAVKTFTAAHGYAAGVTRTIEACALGGTLTITSDGTPLSGSTSGAGLGTWGAAPTTLYLGTRSAAGTEAGMALASISVRGE